MITQLTPADVDRVLQTATVGRIGCSVADTPYVVPISYVYADGCVYGHSPEGQKVRMMRQNPRVCFEVDHVENLGHWQSVIARGSYEELHGAEAQHGLDLLLHRLRQLITDGTNHEAHNASALPHETPVVFRLRLDSLSGREEHF